MSVSVDSNGSTLAYIFHERPSDKRYRLSMLNSVFASWARSGIAVELKKNGWYERNYIADVQPRVTLYKRLAKFLLDPGYYEASIFLHTGVAIDDWWRVSDFRDNIELIDRKSKLFGKQRAAALVDLRAAFVAGICFQTGACRMEKEVTNSELLQRKSEEGLRHWHQLRVAARQSARRITELDFGACSNAPLLLNDLEARRARAISYYAEVDSKLRPLLLRGILAELGITSVSKWCREQLLGWQWYRNGWTAAKLDEQRNKLHRLYAAYNVEDPIIVELDGAYAAASCEIAAFRNLRSEANTLYYGALRGLFQEDSCRTVSALKQHVRQQAESLPEAERGYLEKRLTAWDGEHRGLLNTELKQLLLFCLGEQTNLASQGPFEVLRELTRRIAQDRADPAVYARLQMLQHSLGEFQAWLKAASGLFVQQGLRSAWTDPELACICATVIESYKSDWLTQDQLALAALKVPYGSLGPAEYRFSCGGHEVEVHREVLQRKRGPQPDYFHGLGDFAQKSYEFPSYAPGPETLHMSPVLLQSAVYYLYTGKLPESVLQVYGSQLKRLFEKLLISAFAQVP